MSEHDLNDNLVKLVRYSIVSIERGRERVLVCNKCKVFADKMNPCDFQAWIVADYCRRYRVDPATQKFLRVAYRVLGRWPKAPLYYESNQLERLEEIVLAILTTDESRRQIDSSGDGDDDGAGEAEPEAPLIELEPKPDPEPPIEEDDLTRIKGIGPRISDLLKAAGLSSFRQLATIDPNRLKEILAAAGRGYQIIDPTTWPEQARRLSEKKR